MCVSKVICWHIVGFPEGAADVTPVWTSTAVENYTQYDESDHSNDFDDGEYEFSFSIASYTKEINGNDYDKEYCDPSGGIRALSSGPESKRDRSSDNFKWEHNEPLHGIAIAIG
jgi:hypothetical protein